MSIKCEIKLNDPNSNGVYYAGQRVSGVIEFVLRNQLTVHGIKVNIRGEAHCRWAENNHNITGRIKKSTHTIVYSGSEKYLDSETYVVQKSENGVDISLPAGVHTFHFAYQLPHQLPPSIETTLGHIRYQLVVTIERPHKTNIKYPVQFNVLIPLNLNNFDSIARQPKCVEKLFKFFTFNGSTHPLTLRLSIPRTGYAIGEVLPLTVDADNLSSVDIKCLKFSLLQNIVYHSETPYRKSRLVTNRKVKLKCGMLPKMQRINFDKLITVPYLPVTDDSCRVICVSYDLEVIIKAKGWHNNKKMLVPIIIGNVPLRGTNDDFEEISLIKEMIFPVLIWDFGSSSFAVQSSYKIAKY